MHCFLYLKASLKRRPKLHFTLYIILTCGFILPLLISIYRDSNAYGTEQYLLSETKGETFQISNASEDDCAYFENIAGLSSPYFSDGIIFLHILSDEEWQNQMCVSDYGNLLMMRFSDAGADYLNIRAFDYDSAHGVSNDAAYISGQRLLLLINVIIILLSVFIIQSAYRSHLQHFSADMGTLISCGADRRQIHAIFIWEFVFVFALSAVSAVVISAAAMKLLFSSYLEIQGVPGLAWLIFHIDPLNTALHILIFFVTLSAALFCVLRENDKKSTWTMLRDEGGVKSGRHSPIPAGKSPEAALSAIWRRRTNNVYRSCLLITVPVTVIFLFLFNYLSLNIKSIETPPEYEFRVTKDTYSSSGFTDDEIEYVESMDEVSHIEAFRTIPADYYILESQNPEEPLMSTNILRYSDGAQLNEDEVVVSGNLDEAGYGVGDKIRLLTFTSGVGEETYLSVVGTVPKSSGDAVIDLYLSGALYDSIVETMPVDRIEIKLIDRGVYQTVEEKLQKYFAGGEYRITNRQAQVDFMGGTSEGIYILLAFLFGVLFLFILIILYVKLCDYINNNKKTIRTLFTVGASKRMLHGSYIRQAATAAICAAVVPAAVCSPLILLVSLAVNTAFTVDGAVLLVYLAQSILVGTIYLTPVNSTLRKIFRDL